MKKYFGMACWFNIQKLNKIFYYIISMKKKNIISKDTEFNFKNWISIHDKKNVQPVKNKKKFLQPGNGSLGKIHC